MLKDIFDKKYEKILIDEIRDPKTATQKDLALLESMKDNEIILNFFKMSRPSLSMGYNQNENDPIKENLIKDNVEIFIRETGGTALYFEGKEIVFTICIGKDVVKDNYFIPSIIHKHVSESLNHAFHKLDIKTNIVEKGSKHTYRPKSCNKTLSKYELEFDGKKFVSLTCRKIANKMLLNGYFCLEPTYRKICNFIDDCNADNCIIPVSVSEIKNISEEEIKKSIIEEIL